jgi:hypothetical protein
MGDSSRCRRIEDNYGLVIYKKPNFLPKNDSVLQDVLAFTEVDVGY